MPSLLLIGLDRETLARLEPMLALVDGGREAVATAAEGLERLHGAAYRLVLCRYPLPDLTMAGLLRALRRPSTRSREAGLLVLAHPEMREEARAQARLGPCVVVSLGDSLPAVHAALEALLRLEPRRTLELPVRLAAVVDGAPVAVAARTVNVSLSGMLVESTPALPVACRCRFDLPGLGVGGEAEVVRHARPLREHTAGFALRFLSLAGRDRLQLAARLHDGG